MADTILALIELTETIEVVNTLPGSIATLTRQIKPAFVPINYAWGALTPPRVAVGAPYPSVALAK